MLLRATQALLLLGCLLGTSSVKAQPTAEELRTAIRRLGPLHPRMAPPRRGDWLSIHHEDGQTFRQYLECDPVLPQGQRHVLYIQPLGDFTPQQRRIVALTSEFMGLYFNLPVKPLPDLPLALIPAKARRLMPGWGQRQLLTSYILEDLLKPRLPSDAAALLALTATDLYPQESWQFVFGEASLSERVGVWSIARYGDPASDSEAFRLCLLRSIATASHETGHMFSLQHCIKHPCNMNGSETLEESDRQPLALCPECLAKICWATRTRPQDHLGRLADFCRRNGLAKEEAFYRKQMAALQAGSASSS
jgi:archaemetzincin